MPRTSRNEIVSPFIHLITQGIDREYIFKHDRYKREYLKLLNEIIIEYENVKILAFCIMDNHAHFLIYSKNVKDMSKIMSRLNTSYGIFYNKNRNRVGYVFRNRYYTQQILDRKHLLNTFSYIHRNPVKAKMVLHESEYKFSSFNSYAKNKVNKEKAKLIFGTENYLNQFKYIHKNYSEDNIIDIKEDKENVKIQMKNIIVEFCTDYNTKLEIVKKDNFLLLELVNRIKKNSEATNKMITEFLELGKNRISRISKKLERD